LSQRSSSFCTQTAADLTYQDQKIIGSAQVWQRGIVLQQGSLLLQPDRERWSQLWPQDSHRVIGLHEIMGSPIQTNQLIETLVQAATEVFGIPWQVQDWIPEEQSAIQELAANFQISK
ncbi:MAG: lipoate--protein ligase family protein, partial [Synechococcaceae cyanobacterium SM2_3_2]|nr:lipoate--protein ligase family protein [Synechococcaceae cyanobacterium SM2_3_2]